MIGNNILHIFPSGIKNCQIFVMGGRIDQYVNEFNNSYQVKESIQTGGHPPYNSSLRAQQLDKD